MGLFKKFKKAVSNAGHNVSNAVKTTSDAVSKVGDKVAERAPMVNPFTAKGLANLGAIGAAPLTASFNYLGNLEGRGLAAANQGLGDQATQGADWWADSHNRAAFNRGLGTSALVAGGAAGAGSLAYGLGTAAPGTFAAGTAGALAGGTAGMAGTPNDYLYGGAQQAQDTKDQAQEDATKAAEEKQQQDLLDSLYAKFGVGSSGDAVANARALEGTKNNILNAYQEQMQNSSDSNYLSNLTSARQSAAGAGGLGGSQDQQVRNQLYQAYAGNRAGATQGRVQAGEAMDTLLQNQRQQLEDQIKGRQRTNLSNVNADISGLNSAASGAYAKAASSAIPLAANLGAGYSLANAYGNSNFNKAFTS